MMVRVVRVACLPGGLSIFVDDQQESLVVWVLKKDYTAAQVAMLEARYNRLNAARSRRAAVHAGRAQLRAV